MTNISAQDIINDPETRETFLETYKLNLIIGSVPDVNGLTEDEKIQSVLDMFYELKEDLDKTKFLKNNKMLV